MKNIGLFIISLFLFILPSMAMEIEKLNGVEFWVIGSIRHPRGVDWWWKKLQGEGENFTHSSPNTTTIDLDKALKPGRHMVADAREIKLESSVKKIFFELFPSGGLNKRGTHADTNSDAEQMLKNLSMLPDAISNLSLCMDPESTIEIEHIPHVTTLPSKDNYANLRLLLKEHNPFHCFISPYFVNILQARKFSLDSTESKYYWDKIVSVEPNHKEIISEAAQSVPYVIKVIDIVIKFSGIPCSKINERIDDEIKLIESMGFPSFLEKNGSKSLIIIIAIMTSFYEQKDLMIKFLESKGFKDVRITILDINPYNKRKNVMWINATKI